MKQWTLNDDPNAKREAEAYETPVPSREFLLEQLVEHGKPLSHENMSRRLGITDDDRLEAVRRRMIAMARDGQLIRTPNGAYIPLDPADLVEGRVIGHRDGIGFLSRTDGQKPDLVLPPRQMRRVFDGDIVKVRIDGKDRRGREEAVIVEVVQPNTQTLMGIYRDAQGRHAGGTLVAENSRIAHEVTIPVEGINGARDGQVVEVRITRQPDIRNAPEGEVVEVLGDRMDPGMEIEIAVREHDIPVEFPSDVKTQISGMSDQVAETDKKGRVDLRDMPLVTIDGEDARDFDDAVYAERIDTGWKLYVAIADVSHYVEVGSALDNEARIRGNSVYFPGQVVPMLPELLSNGLCSINPDVDRLCLVCEMEIGLQGNLVGYTFYEGVMRSHARLTYNKVSAMLETADGEEGQALRQQYRHVVPAIEELYALYGALRYARDARGAIDFETTETQIVFNDERKIDRIEPRSRNDAHKLIEECMLAANVATARFLSCHKIPALYRVHAAPALERLENLRMFLAPLGLSLEGGEKPTPADYQQLRERISGRPDEDIIQTVMLRSMSQATYTPHNEGHFGLAYAAYAHFTSPIRRYPDLLVHRAIRSVIRNGKFGETSVGRVEDTRVEPESRWYPYTFEQMVELGEHCSQTERRADEATRDVTDWLKCEFMSDKVGGVFGGKVAAVTSFGLFIRLDEFYVEGLIHISALPSDFYQFEAERYRLRGERSGTVFALGDHVTVQVARVDLDDRKIDFVMADNGTSSSKRRGSSSGDRPVSSRTKKRRKGTPDKTAAAVDTPAETDAVEYEEISASVPVLKKKRKARPGRKERQDRQTGRSADAVSAADQSGHSVAQSGGATKRAPRKRRASSKKD